MIGRTAERGDGARLLEQAAEGHGGALAFVGVAGIGKSTLLNDLADQAVQRGFVVRYVLGTPAEYGLPYAGLHALLAGDLRGAPLSGPLAASIGLVVPEVPPLTHAVATALLEHLSEQAASKPMLIVVDDLQWVDPSTAAVLRTVASSLDADRVAVAFGVRTGVSFAHDVSSDLSEVVRHTPADPSFDSSFDDAPIPIDEVLDQGIGERRAPAFASNPSLMLGPIRCVVLAPLSAEESVDLIAECGVSRLDALRIAEIAGGIPLALIEFGRGSLGDESTRRMTDVTDLYGERLRNLSEEARALCGAVALENRLDALEEMFTGSFLARFAEAEAAEVLRRSDETLQFVHPLLRVSALASMSSDTKRAVHRQLADVLTEDHQADRRAMHLGLAAVGLDDEVAEVLGAFADRARSRGALAESALAMLRASTLTSDASMRTRRVIDAAWSWCYAGDVPGSLAILDRERPKITDDDLLGEIEFAIARTAEWERDVEEIVRMLEGLAARSLEEKTTRSAQALAVSSGMAMMAGDIGHGIASAERAIELADSCDDFLSGILARGNLVWNLMLHGEPERAEDIVGPIAALLKLAAESESVDGLTVAQFLGMIAIFREDWEDAEKTLSTGLSLANRLGVRLSMILFGMVRAQLLWRMGRWDEASLLSREHLDAQNLPAISLAWGSAAAAQIAASKGDHESVRQYNAQAVEIAERLHLPLVEAWAGHARGHLALALGDSEAAVREYQLVSKRVNRIGLVEANFLQWRGDFLSALVASGRRAEAAVALEECRSVAAQTGRRWIRGVIERTEAQLATSLTASIDSFGKALALFRDLEMPFETARTLLARAERILDAKKLSPSTIRLATRDLERAGAVFEVLGATPWSAKVHGVRSRLAGRTEERSPDDGTDVWQSRRATDVTRLVELLTAAEFRVAMSVADGRTNRETAAELGLSHRTVEFHMQSVYRKLNVTNRSACIAVLVRARSAETIDARL